MNTSYGSIPSSQVFAYKKKLHNKVHWLLLYKERNDKELNDYFISLLTQVVSLSEILPSQSAILELLVVLESAYDENLKIDCDYKKYRKYVLDAHTLIDKIEEKEGV